MERKERKNEENMNESKTPLNAKNPNKKYK